MIFCLNLGSTRRELTNKYPESNCKEDKGWLLENQKRKAFCINYVS